MKDYSLNEFQRKNFILNYEINNNRIFIHYADKTTEVRDYSREVEDEILDIMKKQVIDATFFADNLVSMTRTISFPRMFIGYTPFLIYCYSYMLGYYNNNDETIFAKIIIGIALGMGITETIKCINRYKTLKDLEKNMLFQDNNFYLNFNMRIEDKYLEGLSNAAINIIKNTKEEDNIFTFNSIDKMSYNDVKRVLENIEKYNPRKNSFKTRKRR